MRAYQSVLRGSCRSGLPLAPLRGWRSTPPSARARGSGAWTAAIGCQGGDVCLGPARQTCPPATPGSTPCRCRTHTECSSACRSCPWVSLGVTGWHLAAGGRKQNRPGPACAALCPLIRCFRQGGCGHSSPAHSCGVWRGQTSWAVSPLTPAGAHGLPFCCPPPPLTSVG